MPYTQTQLSQYYQSLTGTAPTGADAVLINAYANQSANGTLSDTNALLYVFNAAGVQGTFEVAESTYQFFTGSGVSAAGLAYLEGASGSGNANGLNSTYYTQFNTENRYYNFAINLASAGGPGNAMFVNSYANLTFAQTVSAAYEAIVGSSNVGTAAAQSAIADITSRQAYFTSVAQQRAGGVDAGGAAGQNIALKAIVVGYILEEANKADVGTYAKAIDQLEASVAAGNASYGTNILTTYGPNGSGYNTGFSALSATNGQTSQALTSNIDTITATTGNINYIGTVTNAGDNNPNPQTLQAGDQIRATGGNNTLTITTIGAVGDASGGALINNVQTIDVRPVANANGVATAQLNANNVQGATALYAYVPQGAVTFTNVASQMVGIINDGTTTGGSLTAQYAASAATATLQLSGGVTSAETVTLQNGANLQAGQGLATVNVNSNGGLNTLATLTVPGTVTTMNFAATSPLVITGGVNDAALTTLRATGTNTINLGTVTANALTTLDTTGLTGAGALTATFANAPAATSTFALGAGSDILTFNAGLAAGTNINLGQGQNSVTINGDFANAAGTTTSSIIGGTQGDTIIVTGTVGAATTINSGGGGDTVRVGTVTAGATINGGGNAVFVTTAADYANISTGTGAGAFTTAQRALITGFSTVGISDALAAGGNYDVNAIGAQNFTTVGVANGGAANLSANTGAIVTFATAIAGSATAAANTLGTLNIGLANSATNANDVINLGYTNLPTSAAAGANNNYTSAINLPSTTTSGVAQGVETVNVITSGTTTNAFNVALSLTDAAATTVSISGNESVNLAVGASDTVLRTINGAAATGTITVDVSAFGATGSNTSAVTVTTGSGNDTVYVRDAAQVTTGGVVGGTPSTTNTNFNTVVVGTTSNGNSYSTIVDAKIGDHISFGTTAAGPATIASASVNTTKIVLNNSTAVFQDYLDAAAAGTGTHAISAFDYQGNTYLVEDNNGAATFQNGSDSVVKLAGIHTITTTTAGGAGVAILGS